MYVSPKRNNKRECPGVLNAPGRFMELIQVVRERQLHIFFKKIKKVLAFFFKMYYDKQVLRTRCRQG